MSYINNNTTVNLTTCFRILLIKRIISLKYRERGNLLNFYLLKADSTFEKHTFQYEIISYYKQPTLNFVIITNELDIIIHQDY